MYELGRGQHYLGVGLSALQCIEREGLQFVPDAVLDFGCGYGRVLRFLRVHFPEARLIASEIQPTALSFCARTFQAETFLSSESFAALDLRQRFDLLWCGSLLTHLDQPAANELLSFFERHLTEKGVCFVSAHGAVTEKALRQRAFDYGLSSAGVTTVLDDFTRRGYGYADYPGSRGYGVSLATREGLREMAAASGLLEVGYQPASWDDHHDVYVFRRSM